MLLGAAFLPVTARLFRTFDDRGWLFSKVLGTMLGGYAVWALSVCFHMPFSRMTAILVTAFFAVLTWLFKLAGMRNIHNVRKGTVNGKGTGTVAGTGTETVAGTGTGACAYTGLKPDLRLIIAEEILFLAVLIIWVYFIGFYPEATGTEKPMDYGFMAAFDRSTAMPARDIWYGTDAINYYYGGQYFAVYFAKLAFTEVTYAYNMMRALIAAFVFVMPFSMVRQLLMKTGKKRRIIAALGGLLGAGAVSCAGNLHYVLYGLFGKLFRLSGWEDYWFPESTRFIGHNPPTDDACIHEFPSYSFVLGDMHAHMINLIFVLLFLGIFIAWLLESSDNKLVEIVKKSRNGSKASNESKASKGSKVSEGSGNAKTGSHGGFITIKAKECFPPHLLLMAAMTGMFKWTNYWDFIIYLTVLIFGMGLLLIRKIRHGASLKQQAAVFVIRLIAIWLIGRIIAFPFTSRFDMMVSSVALAKNHTAFYQFAILWGLPVVTLIVYAVWLFRSCKTAAGSLEIAASGSAEKTAAGSLESAASGSAEKTAAGSLESAASGREKSAARSTTLPMPYYIALLLGICALGLILIPEVVYVKDIYEEGFSRSNTMFKLTYQAFVMFGLFFGFALPELLVNRLPETLTRTTAEAARNTAEDKPETSSPAGTSADIHPVQLIGGVLTVILLLTFGYLPYSVKCWFGNVLSPDGFIGISATDFLDENYPEDVEAIQWLDENIDGQPIVLEAWGDSYSEDCRVSAYTGIPTVMGWYVHEWLWRENVDELNKRVEDVNAIYTITDDPADQAAAREILKKYDVQYIFVGSCERMKYEDLDEDALRLLGTVVFETESVLDGNTFIIKVD